MLRRRATNSLGINLLAVKPMELTEIPRIQLAVRIPSETAHSLMPSLLNSGWGSQERTGFVNPVGISEE